ncbi:Eco57I restriction-modification methylase domain-containing protein [Haloarcula amylovorans]|uniref:Eco57I restriction-modification methylase domain-containing protein n=1 Tax=Haloarcula amylovorans TaxID=2562280 RepID=UPI0010764D97|nr:TaqI-like C-terminal specificity domain-containing protein [Halomicroarcula amylolytica]
MGNDRGDVGTEGGGRRELGREVAENVAEALEVLAEGFFEYPDNDLGRSALTERGLLSDDRSDFEAARLGLVYESSLVYLYRLLVVLYAESEERHLPETKNGGYERGGLHSLKRAVAARLDSADSAYSSRQTDLWSRLDELFERLDRDSTSLGTDEEAPSVPAYDSWLFRTDPDEGNPRETRFLADYAVSDAHLARVVELLTRHEDDGETSFIDYSSLAVRQLGSIHETLLQYRLDVADEPLTLTDGAYTAAGDGDHVVVPTGSIYLTTDDGERKATGAYYTPEYVVEHVVERTLGPLVRDIRADLEAEHARRDGTGGDGAQGDSADEFTRRVLDLSVLDPAMGSGHFLLAVVEYLAREIVAERERQAQSGDESVDATDDMDRARRQVARHCVYGVDLDPLAVELATASLWLRASVANRPLTSLDRHLKTGNALVGSDIEEIPAAKSEYGRCEREWRRRRLTAIANVYTAERFGLDTVPADAYQRMAAALEDDEVWATIEKATWFQEAQRLAADDSYFHWKLEFPEMYYDESGDPLDRPGFDAVVGNPPWVATAGRANVSAAIATDLRAYLEDAFETTQDQFDLYVAFYEQAIRQSQTGRVGFVVPDSVLTREQNEPIRAYVLEHTSLVEILQVGAVFEGVESGAVILVSGDETDAVRCASATDADRTNLDDIAYDPIPSRVFEAQDAARFLLYLDADTRSILDKIERQPPLGEFITISRGEEMSKRAERLAESPQGGEGTRPIAPGGAVRRYGIDDEELRYVEAADLEKDERNYESPKLVFRQTSASLVGTLDSDGLATIKSAYNIHIESGSTDELKHLLGVLNSSVLNFYHHYKHAAYRTVFPQINQSTFEALPTAMSEGPDSELVDAVGRMLSLTAERSRLDLDLTESLGTYEFGPSLGTLSECCPAEGVSTTKLGATADEWPNLRIGDVRAESSSNGLVIAASARYKPDDDTVETDRWGYAETEPIPALELDGVDDERETLVEAFVPYAADRREGFADFRANATQSSSLVTRLQSLTLPRLDDVAAGLREFSDERARARQLDRRIEALDSAIERRVCSLYGLSADERDVIRKEFDSG